MNVGEVNWSLLKMSQAFTGYMRISNQAISIMYDKMVQETIFDKLKSKNISSLVINGGAIYQKLI